jgi:hypothetical protein
LLLLQQTLHSEDQGRQAESDIAANVGAEPPDPADMAQGSVRRMTDKAGKIQLIIARTRYILGEDVNYQMSRNVPTSNMPIVLFNGSENAVKMKRIVPLGTATARDIIVAIVDGTFNDILGQMK